MIQFIPACKRYFAALAVAFALSFTASCGTARQQSASVGVEDAITERVWIFSQTHPDGFTLDIRTMTEPTHGVSVAYAQTQNSHSRKDLPKVVSHSLTHDGYIGGWKESDTGLYYFDSVRLFPEDSLQAAITFALENEQLAIYVLSTGEEIDLSGKKEPAE
jgi:hypothetical protein